MSKSLIQTEWSRLLTLALEALDTLPPATHWTWGGGTALAFRLDHRISFDIDIFLTDAEAMRLLSPQRNPTMRAITDKWQEPGHYLKLQRDEGEIDFIVSALRTEPGYRAWTFDGRDLPLETAAEVLAKKLHWRGSRELARDVFDMAAAWRLDPGSLAEAIAASPEGARRAADEITRRYKRIARELPNAVNPTAVGEEILLKIDLLELASVLRG
ncbi:MAG: nucleotidyl transferase AbiEii/AbiGii toxin family protein [Proteobacteria bacterium]|nr:nucleotidyl transferase AbiEii/AbiGii toxin family protein [Pseudomonadota bacterium]